MKDKLSEISLFQILIWSLLVTMLLATSTEIGLRVTSDSYQRGVYMYDSDLVWTFIEDKSVPAFGHRIRTNDEGFRDEPLNRAGDKNLTIAVLGDSYTAGFRVPEEERFTEVLEDNLNKEGVSAEVYNFGVLAYATDQQVLAYENNVRRINPDIVLLMVAPNDIRESYNKELFRLENQSLHLDENNRAFNIDEEDRLMWYLSSRSTLIFKTQRLFGKNYGTAERLFDETTEGVFFEDNRGLGPAGILFKKKQTDEVSSAEKLWVKLIARLNNKTRQDSTELAMFLLPIEKQFNSFPQNERIDADHVSELFNRTAENHSIDSKDLYKQMKKRNNTEKYFLSDNYHYSSKGHKFVGSYLTDYILSRKDLQRD